MSLHADFLAEIEAYLEATGMPPTTFGLLVMDDPRFVFSLRAGRSPRLQTVDKVREWIAQHSRE